MIAKVCPNARRTGTRGCPFGARIAYVSRKAVVVRSVNLCGGWQDARAQMQMARGLNTAVQNPAAHIILSWPETDCPSENAMITAARLVMIDFGAASHQMVIAVHRDRPNSHVHIVLNRVHPVTGKALPLWQDYRRLELACRRVETRMGWSVDRGRFDVDQGDTGLTLVPKPQAHWRAKAQDRLLGLRQTPYAARALERRSGLPVLLDILSPKVQIWLRQRLTSASHWQESHDALRRYDLRYVLHRGGARIVHRASAWGMAASQLGTACGLWAMQNRIGAYETDPVENRSAAALSDPSTPEHGEAQSALLTLTATLLKPIRDKREAQQHAHRAARQARRQLHEAQAAETAEVRHILRGSKSPMAQALRHVMNEQHKTARQQLRSATQGIHSRATLPLDAIAQADPQEAARRRYRDILRRAAIREVQGGIVSGQSDLTSARQTWFTAPLRTQDSGLPSALRNAIAGHADDIRVDGVGGLLLPHRRQDGGIAGFTRIDLGERAQRNQPVQYGAPGGLILIGQRDANRCLIVLDSMTAFTSAVRLRDQPVLIIAVSAPIDPAEAIHLKSLTQGRDTTVGSTSHTERHDVMNHLANLLPSARLVWWDGKHAGTAMQEEQTVDGRWMTSLSDQTKGPEPKQES
ncbi:relaxase/mobilization nuclease domain-containing protein [Pseudotabrizicola alkalilacus]|uniref:MobA/VirD2-like nuclease domain-containing protein n=1 Tax=Pseudotabrizicola alkalilacus TaxID=2305252 RepID=A0A411YWS9_9RHOB|nr:relaxase/mobilization nuclease domain-containing protein [Pseudotabrizicola alkalilacus]RGP35185.1 hypothetical protein D1012_21305 [Pseudotabrizicola alkalilacus]